MARKKKRRFSLPQENRNFFDSNQRNVTTYQFLLDRMCAIWLDRFIYDNMPDTIDIPTLQNSLLYRGHVAYFVDGYMGDLALGGALSNAVDIYNYPSEYQITAANGYYTVLSVSKFALDRNGVVIYDNFNRSIPFQGILYYADKLFVALRAADVNLDLQAVPNIVRTSQANRLTVENILMKVEGYQSRVVVDDDLDINKTEVINLTVPYIADKVWTYITNIWNDFLTWCGIENATNQKRERLVSNEVNANYGNVEMERNTGLNSRIIGFDEVNALFDREITVRFNSDLMSGLNAPMVDDIIQVKAKEGDDI